MVLSCAMTTACAIVSILPKRGAGIEYESLAFEQPYFSTALHSVWPQLHPPMRLHLALCFDSVERPRVT